MKVYVDVKKLFIMCAKKGYSRRDLSEKSGISYATLRCHLPVRPTTLYKLSQALGCEPEELLKED